MQFTIFSASGEVSGCYTRQDVLDILPLLGDGEDFVQGRYPHGEFYFEDDAPVPIPERPSDTAVFDYGTKAWIEPFTAEELLDQKRAVATLDRFTFCSRCREKSIISAADALVLGRGEVPPDIRAILDQMDDADTFAAELRWAAMSTVGRIDPLITAIMSKSGIPDAMLDHIFNIYPYTHDPEPEEAP